jgi:shikimate kinase
MKENAFVIWLKVPVEILLGRVKKRDTRPLLKNPDPAGTLEKLLVARAPFYSEADMTLETAEEPHGAALDTIVAGLLAHGLWQVP